MKVKKFLSMFLLAATSAGITSCGGTEVEDEPKDPTEVDPMTYFVVGEDYKTLPTVTSDYTNGFYDSFESFNKDNWYVGKGYWGSNNGGVSPRNVHLTDNGELAIRGTGLHYARGDLQGYGNFTDGRNVGGTIVSKFLTGPGHYEVKMKVLPRTGACTAFWTYTYRTNESGAADNHEIDVELPGGIKSGKVTFKKALNTNWITEADSNSVEYAIEDVNQDADYVAYNDGEYHTFGFDWYTDPGVVVYFCDGKITNVSNVFVPSLQTRITLGCWFPPSLVGSANFESDYMFVDYVEYTPFKDQPFEEFNADPGQVSEVESDYNITPITIEAANKVSNGDFEYAKNYTSTGEDLIKELSTKGWTFTRIVSEEMPVSEVCRVVKGAGTGSDDLYAAVISDGGVLRQDIDSVYDNYKFKLSFDAKSLIDTEDAQFRLNFLGSSTGDVLAQNVINIKGSDFSNYTKEFTAPVGTESIRIEVRSGTGNTVTVDNINLEFLGA